MASPAETQSRIRAAKTEDEVVQIMNETGFDWASAVGLRAQAKIESIRHHENLAPVWYKHPATWIALAAVIISLLSWLFPRVPN